MMIEFHDYMIILKVKRADNLYNRCNMGQKPPIIHNMQLTIFFRDRKILSHENKHWVMLLIKLG